MELYTFKMGFKWKIVVTLPHRWAQYQTKVTWGPIPYIPVEKTDGSAILQIIRKYGLWFKAMELSTLFCVLNWFEYTL